MTPIVFAAGIERRQAGFVPVGRSVPGWGHRNLSGCADWRPSISKRGPIARTADGPWYEVAPGRSCTVEVSFNPNVFTGPSTAEFNSMVLLAPYALLDYAAALPDEERSRFAAKAMQQRTVNLYAANVNLPAGEVLVTGSRYCVNGKLEKAIRKLQQGDVVSFGICEGDKSGARSSGAGDGSVTIVSRIGPRNGTTLTAVLTNGPRGCPRTPRELLATVPALAGSERVSRITLSGKDGTRFVVRRMKAPRRPLTAASSSGWTSVRFPGGVAFPFFRQSATWLTRHSCGGATVKAISGSVTARSADGKRRRVLRAGGIFKLPRPR
jgi:hypothetical protein